MTPTSLSCLICYRSWEQRDELLEKPSRQELLARFFKVVERYLAGSKSARLELKPNLNEILVTPPVFLNACDDCSAILQSFCQLYQKMKETELQLNWKLGTLVNIMRCGRKVKPRMKAFNKNLDWLSENSTHELFEGSKLAKDFINYKKQLEKLGSKKLSRALPTVKIKKVGLHKPESTKLMGENQNTSEARPTHSETNKPENTTNIENENQFEFGIQKPDLERTYENATVHPHFRENFAHTNILKPRFRNIYRCGDCSLAFSTRRKLLSHSKQCDKFATVPSEPEEEPGKYTSKTNSYTQKSNWPNISQQSAKTRILAKSNDLSNAGGILKLKFDENKIKVVANAGKRRFPCNLCKATYTRRYRLQAHVDKIHLKKARQQTTFHVFKCIKCPKAFRRNDMLKRHFLLCHMDRAQCPFVCDISSCQKRFPFKFALNRHRLIHTKRNSDKAFACERCGLKYFHRFSLHRHSKEKHGMT